MIHTTDITVRGYHLDLYRHVNNARYLEFLEEARWQFMEDSGLITEFDGSKLGLAVVNININYRRGAYVNEQLQIHSQFKKIGHRSAGRGEAQFRIGGEVADQRDCGFACHGMSFR